MDLKLLAPILAVYATTRWSVGNPHPMILHGNINMSLNKMDVVNRAEHEYHEYPGSIKDMIPKLERKSRELGIASNKYLT